MSWNGSWPSEYRIQNTEYRIQKTGAAPNAKRRTANGERCCDEWMAIAGRFAGGRRSVGAVKCSQFRPVTAARDRRPPGIDAKPRLRPLSRIAHKSRMKEFT